MVQVNTSLIRENILRTPESCFHNLPDYPFKPNYIFIDNIRVHYLDEGENINGVVVMLHGEPSWSYLYRNMIPYFTDAGYRVIAPDLIGFGKSDKPSEPKLYSYTQNTEWVHQLLFKQLRLTEIHLIAHDWGGLIGLRLVAQRPKLFNSVVIMNTAFPRIEGFNPVFFLWWMLSGIVTSIPFRRLMSLGIVGKSSKEILKAYDAPFPKKRFRVAPRVFPRLVPIFPWQQEAKTNKRLWKELCRFENPFLTIFSNKDPFTRRVEEDFISEIKGAQGQPHLKVKNAGHFLQEDEPEQISEHILNFFLNIDKQD